MDLGQGAILLALAAYVAAQIGVSVWVSRGVADSDDYFLAGRRLGLWPVGLSLFATWFGAETVLGSSAVVAEEGLAGARAEPFGYAICLLAMGLFIAARFREGAYLNLADFFKARFGPQAEVVAAVIMIPVSVVWAGAQLLALAAILEAVLGAPQSVTLAVAAALVITYTTIGGIAGDIVTDMIQSVVMMIGISLILFATADRFGGLAQMTAAIQPDQLRILGEGETWLAQLDAWAIPILGSLITQEALSRILSARSAGVARRATFLAAGLYLAMGLAPLLIGLAGVHLALPGAEGDAFLPAVARELMAPVLFVIFTGGLLSVILSTVDSNVLSVSSFVSLNLLPRFTTTASAATRLALARGTTIAAGLSAWAVAASGSSIYDLIALTSVFGQGGILVATLIGLRGAFGGPLAALAAMGAGVAVNLATLAAWPAAQLLGQGLGFGEALGLVAAGEGPTVDGYFLLSIAAALAAYLIAAQWEKRPAV